MNEPRSFRVEAVVLRHSDWGEADRLLTLFTREHGKMTAVAKGIRKVRSRKAGHLEPFTRVAIQLARGHSMPIVTQADTVDAYLPLRADLLRTGIASYVVELVDRFTYEDDTENFNLYRILTESLARVSEEPDPWLAVRYYEVRLLDFLGFRPHLFECANCGKPTQPVNQFFSYSQGGILCPNCGAGLNGVREITVDTLKYLRHFQRSNYADAKRAHPKAEVRAEVEALLQGYFSFLLERELNSPGFIKQIKA